MTEAKHQGAVIRESDPARPLKDAGSTASNTAETLKLREQNRTEQKKA